MRRTIFHKILTVSGFALIPFLGNGGLLAESGEGNAIDPAAEAPAIWQKLCVSCHGKDGVGRTKAGRRAKVKNFTDPEYQGKLKDEEMAKAIRKGIKEGEKNRMKPYGEKLTGDQIAELVAFVRKFKSE